MGYTRKIFKKSPLIFNASTICLNFNLFDRYLFRKAVCNFKVGWPIPASTTSFGISEHLTMVATKKQFFCNGEVSTWRYKASAPNGFQAIVFRPLDGSRTKFEVVGINNIPAAGEINTQVSYVVPEGNRIRVQRGDVIGWSFETGVIQYNEAQDNDGSNLVRWIDRRTNPVDTMITFDGGFGSRKYPIEATVSMNCFLCTGI